MKKNWLSRCFISIIAITKTVRYDYAGLKLATEAFVLRFVKTLIMK